MSALKACLTGLVATIAILFLVVGVPVLLTVIGAVPDLADFSRDRLTAADDGNLAIAVITVIGWTAWLVITGSVLVEFVSQVRGIRTPTLRGLGIPQSAARHLVGMAALLFVAAPLTPQVFAAPPASAAPIAVNRASAAPSATPTAQQPPTTQAQPGSTHGSPPTRSYTVRRGDSLWKIAEAHLGDGRRYTEIVALNEPVLGGQPDFILPGTTLRLPDEPPADRHVQRLVKAGDTLASIAEQEYGDPNAWPRIFNASVGTVQPDGSHLSDPDLIRPGWRLTIPPVSETREDPVDGPDHHQPQPSNEPVPEPTRTPTLTPESAGKPRVDQGQTHSSAGVDEESPLPAWLLPGLAGAGGLLAGSLFLALRAGRRTQWRYRRPGFVLSAPPEELRRVEKSIHHVGSATAQRLEVLDRALRHLAFESNERPSVVSVEVTEKDIRVKGPTGVAPAPWRTADGLWIASLDTDFGCEVDEPPYPLLVSLGVTQGTHVLVNLEELATVSFTGDSEACLALARHVATELTLNPWSARVEVTTLGIGHELSDLDPLRLHQHDASDLAAVDQFAEDLEGDDESLPPEPFRVLVAATPSDSKHSIQRAAKVVTAFEGRSGAAVLTAADELNSAVIVTLSPDRRLRCEALGLDITAAGLTADEAEVCAAIIDLTREAPCVEVPQPSTSPNQTGIADQTGALLPEHTEERTTEPAGQASLLPRATATYATSASTTTDDVNRLAPAARPEVKDRLDELDPTLDSDLADWHDPASSRPRLSLLGPVSARTSGDVKAIRQRRPFYVELLAYLALHPAGVSSAQVADAFNLTPERARVDLGALRHWLGANTEGEMYLPSARSRQARGEAGGPVYRIDDLLIDWDLFTRLRSRGQARGATGIDDLFAALRLVSGEPFTSLRPAGWDWLLDGDRTDHISTCAIVDVAHLVTTHALAEKDFDLARISSEIGYHAAPDDEISRLDMVAVATATGHSDLAQRQLIDEVLGRSDDDLGPIEVPGRTHEVVNARGGAKRA